MLRNNSSKPLLALLALVATLPIAVFAAASLVSQLPDFFNACMRWGISSGSVTVSSAGLCSTVSAISETMPQVALRLALIQGGILAAFGIGMFGIVGSRTTLLTVASTILLLESIPLVFDGLFVLTLPPAFFLLWVARKPQTRQQALGINSEQL